MSEKSIIDEMETRIIRAFLDIIILQVLNDKSGSGYDILLFLEERFHKKLSSGTVYAAIYSLQRKGLIVGVTDSRKTIFKITVLGKETLDIIQKAEKELRIFRLGSFNINSDLLNKKHIN